MPMLAWCFPLIMFFAACDMATIGPQRLGARALNERGLPLAAGVADPS